MGRRVHSVMACAGIGSQSLSSQHRYQRLRSGDRRILDLSRAEELYQRTEYGRAIDVLQALEGRDAAAYALLGKACFMQGQYKQAVASLEKAVGEDSLNSDYYDWLGRAYGRLAEESSFLSALGYAKKTVRAFERAVELGPSNLEALSDVFEYYLQAPGMVGGGVDKAENIARRFAGLNAAEYHWARARLAEKRKDFETAEREFRAAFADRSQRSGARARSRGVSLLARQVRRERRAFPSRRGQPSALPESAICPRGCIYSKQAQTRPGRSAAR